MVVKSLVYLADEIRVDLSPLAAQCIASEERTWLVLIPLPAFKALTKTESEVVTPEKSS